VSNESGVVENGDFRFFRSLSSEHFTAPHDSFHVMRLHVDDLGVVFWRYFKVIRLFTSNFS